MSKKTSPCILSVEAAGELLGLDAQAVRICIRAGHFGDFARAIKSKPTNECYLYIISKFKLYQYLGLDVNLSTEETLELVRQGKPPFIEQTSYPIKDLLSEMKSKGCTLFERNTASTVSSVRKVIKE